MPILQMDGGWWFIYAAGLVYEEGSWDVEYYFCILCFAPLLLLLTVIDR